MRSSNRPICRLDPSKVHLSVSKQVTCVNKRTSRYPPHQRISHIGGKGWKRTHAEAIAEIRADYMAYYVGAIYLVIRRHEGHDYLTTELDGETQKSLLALPECR